MTPSRRRWLRCFAEMSARPRAQSASTHKLAFAAADDRHAAPRRGQPRGIAAHGTRAAFGAATSPQWMDRYRAHVARRAPRRRRARRLRVRVNVLRVRVGTVVTRRPLGVRATTSPRRSAHGITDASRACVLSVPCIFGHVRRCALCYAAVHHMRCGDSYHITNNYSSNPCAVRLSA
jgi:hypothetical protein